MSEYVEAVVPGDKSVSHRALMLAATADGASRLRGLLPAADPRSTAEALRRLGIAVPATPDDGGEIVVAGRGIRGFATPDRELDCGNSGTTARLLMGLLAGCPLQVTLTGDASLRSRPMRRVTEPLARMGARFHELGRPDRLPIRLEGGDLSSIEYESPRASAQVKSAILLAAVSAGVPVTVSEPFLSRDHTERMLRAMGVRVETSTGVAVEDMAVSRRTGLGAGDVAAPEHPDRPRIRLEPPERLEPLDLDVPGDFSAAAFLVALALLSARHGATRPLRIRGVGVNPTRTGMLAVLQRMGAPVRLEGERTAGGEPVADLVVEPMPPGPFRITPDEVPALLDEIPVLAVLAARAPGESVIEGAAELRVKETDRIAGLAHNLRGIGVEVEELEDGLTIQGTEAPLAGRIRTDHDHRIAMAFGVLGAFEAGRIQCDYTDCVAVSYPGFWRALEDLAAALAGSRRAP